MVPVLLLAACARPPSAPAGGVLVRGGEVSLGPFDEAAAIVLAQEFLDHHHGDLPPAEGLPSAVWARPGQRDERGWWLVVVDLADGRTAEVRLRDDSRAWRGPVRRR